MTDEAKGLLSGITVLEMGHVVAAPISAMLLADMGADVIKVERLPAGDSVRGDRPSVDGESAYFAMLNRNKRGLALNMKSAGGRGVLRSLLGKVDVFIENYRTGAMTHYGIGYDQIKEACPRLVYCSITGFGQTGPYAAKGGFDLVAQGMSGLMSVTGEGPGRPPVKMGVPVTDITAGTLAALGILGAIIRRSVIGRGQQVDTSLFEAGTTHAILQSSIHLASGRVPGAMGSAHPVMASYQAFQSANGWLIVGAGNQNNWLKLTQCLEAPELADDPRFADSPARIDHLEELVEVLNGYFAKLTNEELLARLDEAGVPAGPVLDIGQMNADPQALARGMIAEVGSASGAPMRVLGHPLKYSEAPASIRRPAPLLGQHSSEVLTEFGFTGDEIATLAGAGDIGRGGDE